MSALVHGLDPHFHIPHQLSKVDSNNSQSEWLETEGNTKFFESDIVSTNTLTLKSVCQ